MGVINTPLRVIIGDFFQNNTKTQTISLVSLMCVKQTKISSVRESILVCQIMYNELEFYA